MSRDFSMELAEGTENLSNTISKRILQDMMPDQADNSDIYIEEYCQHLLNPASVVDQNRRLGFIAENSVLIALSNEWFAALVCGIVVEMVNDFLKERQRKRDFSQQEKIESLEKKAQELAVNNGMDASKVEEFSRKFTETFLTKALLFP
jgi:hypothetical protein